jgi:hypothetical protein
MSALSLQDDMAAQLQARLSCRGPGRGPDQRVPVLGVAVRADTRRKGHRAVTTSDPFDRIPDPDSSYAGTVLETSAEREQRAAESSGPPSRTGPYPGRRDDR